MGIFSRMMDKIMGRDEAKPAPKAAAPVIKTPQATTAAPAPAPVAAPAPPPVDIEAVLTAMAEKAGQPLNWRTSIVDLMKLVGMDSSLTERKALADELGFTGDKSDSASMNIWLHKQVMKKLAENGGKVPAALLD
jgi:Domain of unknown function (DUF3597)